MFPKEVQDTARGGIVIAGPIIFTALVGYGLIDTIYVKFIIKPIGIRSGPLVYFIRMLLATAWTVVSAPLLSVQGKVWLPNG